MVYTTERMTLLDSIRSGNRMAVAEHYISLGLSVIPVRADGSKAPALAKGEVEQYRERFATGDELSAWFAPNRAAGVAIVCGKVSGNLAVIDFETETAWQQWRERAEALDITEWFEGFPLVRTPKGGRHLYCRIAEHAVAGGKLARRSGQETLIEVRGEGHYVLAPGCPVSCHPLNLPYTLESAGWLDG